MELTLHVPDDLAARLGTTGIDLSRRALEAWALDEFKGGHLTAGELRRLLGFETRWELDAFLKAHSVFEAYTADDLARDRSDLKDLGL